MALTDIINKRKAQRTGPASSQALAQRQQTLATGKAGMGQTGPAMSNIQAQVAAQAGQAQQAQQQFGFQQQQRRLAQAEAQGDQQFQAQQAAMGRQIGQAQQALANQQLMQAQQRTTQDQMATERLQRGEAAQLAEMQNSYSNALANLASQRGIVENDLFAELKRNQQQMGYDQFLASVDQLGHAMAMSDRRYTDEIQRVGRLNDLQDRIAFKEEATRIAFNNELEALSEFMDLQSLINMDTRQLKRELQKMDHKHAMKIAAQAAKERNYKMILTGGINMLGAANQAGAFSGGSSGGSAPTGNIPQSSSPSFSSSAYGNMA